MVSLVTKYTASTLTKCPFLQFARNIVNTQEPLRKAIQIEDSTESNFMTKCPFAKYLTENPTLFQQAQVPPNQPTPKPAPQHMIVRKDNYNEIFNGVLDKIKGEGRYREFIQIQRQTGQFPEAIFHSSNYFHQLFGHFFQFFFQNLF